MGSSLLCSVFKSLHCGEDDEGEKKMGLYSMSIGVYLGSIMDIDSVTEESRATLGLINKASVQLLMTSNVR